MRARWVWGAVKTFFYLRTSKVRMTITATAQEIVDRMEGCPQGKILVVMTGMSLAGKTTYVANHPQLKRFGQIRTRDIHDSLNRNLEFLKDDNSVRGRSYWVRQFLTEVVRKEALNLALRRGISLVLDSCHLTRKKRAERCRLAKQHGYGIVIVFVDCPWTTLISRARAADDESVAQGRKMVWEKLVRQQVRSFEPPTDSEADQFIINKYGYWSLDSSRLSQKA